MRATSTDKAARLVVMSDDVRTVVVGDHAAYDVTDGACTCTAARYGSTCSHRVAARAALARRVDAGVLDLVLADPRDRRRTLAALARLLDNDALEDLIGLASEAVVSAQMGGAA